MPRPTDRNDLPNLLSESFTRTYRAEVEARRERARALEAARREREHVEALEREEDAARETMARHNQRQVEEFERAQNRVVDDGGEALPPVEEVNHGDAIAHARAIVQLYGELERAIAAQGANELSMAHITARNALDGILRAEGHKVAAALIARSSQEGLSLATSAPLSACPWVRQNPRGWSHWYAFQYTRPVVVRTTQEMFIETTPDRTYIIRKHPNNALNQMMGSSEMFGNQYLPDRWLPNVGVVSF